MCPPSLPSHLLSLPSPCAPCGCPYMQVRQQGTVFGFILRCPGSRKKMSLAKDSMFPELKMSFVLSISYDDEGCLRVCQHCCCWICFIMSSATVVQWYSTCATSVRGSSYMFLMRLCGRGREVQMDESVIAWAKYHCDSRLAKRTKCVFGIYDPVSKDG